MAISSKHHYIPQFFLEGFTNESGQFYIYDKKRKVIKTKEYFPSTHFFHKNRNSILVNDQIIDGPEQLYGIFENKNKEIIKYLQDYQGVLSLGDEKLVELQHFLSNLFIRLPVLDGIVNRLMREMTLKDLMFTLKDKAGQPAPIEVVNEIKNSQNFIDLYRPALGSIIMLKSNSLHDTENWRIAFNDKNNHLLSDNPLIFDDLNKLDFFENQFVIPLTNRYKLVRSKTSLPNGYLPAKFALLSEILQLHQAREYVCSSSKEHLENMVKASKIFSNEYSRNQLFESLNEQ